MANAGLHDQRGVKDASFHEVFVGARSCVEALGTLAVQNLLHHDIAIMPCVLRDLTCGSTKSLGENIEAKLLVAFALSTSFGNRRDGSKGRAGSKGQENVTHC